MRKPSFPVAAKGVEGASKCPPPRFFSVLVGAVERDTRSERAGRGPVRARRGLTAPPAAGCTALVRPAKARPPGGSMRRARA